MEDGVLASPVAACKQHLSVIFEVDARPHAQKVRLMMMLFASKCEAMSQSVLGKYAVGVPCRRLGSARLDATKCDGSPSYR